MSTAILFVVCVLLVFSPFLLEIVRAAGKLARRIARRPAPEPPEYGAAFESSVHDALYGNEPRWQQLEVRSAEPGAGRPQPPYVVGRPETGAPLRSVKSERREEPDYAGETQAA
jgi:hypothetical protein